ncbi:MAG: heavy-metal-associated domain-containing protein [Propionibacteriaceae bacterium]|jgi:copper chaperone CopZ|uniref:Copper chaperone CopZ n=1 Tax=Micropruina glycogenica TaxID=75385 RepID=A0A2N9JCS7_9ACTN|nr:heavy-metal-associated domain-containing protein [Micropruina glycogenica]MCB0892507.1 heavy-metal-associated domain-containing protein [Propionibacteriaceae bacterium]SPD85917.1 Copper chaperone CopZ [Micropruina glycogenica]
MTTTEFQVTGMTCGHCEQAVSQEVGQIAGVAAVEVSAATGRLLVTTDVTTDVTAGDVVTDEQVLAAVDDAGYTAIRR